MVTRKQADDTVEANDTDTSKSKATSGDAGAAELQALTDEATSKGYFGSTPDPHPNEAYSLASGPDSPSAASVTPKPKEG